MRKLIILTLISTLWIVSHNVSSAHPGRTDSDGGHRCWTNCEKWGLEYGEYHYHDQPSTKSSKNYNNDKSDRDEDNRLSSSELDYLFSYGYNEGYETAIGDFNYNDFEIELSELELKTYKKGYYAGYVEGGGGNLFEHIYYYLLHKYLPFTISTAVLTLFSLYRFSSRKNNK